MLSHQTTTDHCEQSSSIIFAVICCTCSILEQECLTYIFTYFHSIDDWECRQEKWSRTASVLRHMHTEMQTKYDTESKSIRLMLLCGTDMIASFPKLLPNGDRLWQDNDV